MSDPLAVRTVASRLGVLNAFARMPFRFGVVTIHAAAQAVLELTVETTDGRRATGYAADFLSYKWFDKRPERTPQEGSDDLIRSIDAALAAYADAGLAPAFAHWRDLHPGLEEQSLARGYNRIGANFGVSMVERAMIDAIGRLAGQSFDTIMRGPLLGIDEASVFPELEAGSLAAALPAKPLERIALRHTVGLVDPISYADIALEDRVGDGFPETLEEYLRDDGVRYLKVKVSGDTAADLDRLTAIWQVTRSLGAPVAVTLDGNEQYASIEEFACLIEAVRADAKLAAFYDSVLFVEQPVERGAALAGPLDAAALDAVGKPLLIDEADGWTTAFAEAMTCGYSGVSHKNCKGVFRSFLNNALASARNEAVGEARYFLSAEDLTDLPVVSLQSDLVAVASLGIPHVERNGHHYFRGLDHLSPAEQASALANHPGLYRKDGGTISLDVEGGALDISSLQVPGFGFADAHDMSRLVPAADWRFSMLERD